MSKKRVEDVSNFCDLLKISELQLHHTYVYLVCAQNKFLLRIKDYIFKCILLMYFYSTRQYHVTELFKMCCSLNPTNNSESPKSRVTKFLPLYTKRWLGVASCKIKIQVDFLKRTPIQHFQPCFLVFSSQTCQHYLKAKLRICFSGPSFCIAEIKRMVCHNNSRKPHPPLIFSGKL